MKQSREMADSSSKMLSSKIHFSFFWLMFYVFKPCSFCGVWCFFFYFFKIFFFLLEVIKRFFVAAVN